MVSRILFLDKFKLFLFVPDLDIVEYVPNVKAAVAAKLNPLLRKSFYQLISIMICTLKNYIETINIYNDQMLRYSYLDLY